MFEGALILIVEKIKSFIASINWLYVKPTMDSSKILREPSSSKYISKPFEEDKLETK